MDNKMFLYVSKLLSCKKFEYDSADRIHIVGETSWLSSDYARSDGTSFGEIAPDGHSELVCEAHVVCPFHQRKRRPRRPSRYGTDSEPSCEGKRTVLRPHARRCRRHARPRQKQLVRRKPDHSYNQRPPKPRHVARHLPLRIPQLRRSTKTCGDGGGRGVERFTTLIVSVILYISVCLIC